MVLTACAHGSQTRKPVSDSEDSCLRTSRPGGVTFLPFTSQRGARGRLGRVSHSGSLPPRSPRSRSIRALAWAHPAFRRRGAGFSLFQQLLCAGSGSRPPTRALRELWGPVPAGTKCSVQVSVPASGVRAATAHGPLPRTHPHTWPRDPSLEHTPHPAEKMMNVTSILTTWTGIQETAPPPKPNHQRNAHGCNARRAGQGASGAAPS